MGKNALQPFTGSYCLIVSKLKIATNGFYCQRYSDTPGANVLSLTKLLDNERGCDHLKLNVKNGRNFLYNSILLSLPSDEPRTSTPPTVPHRDSVGSFGSPAANETRLNETYIEEHSIDLDISFDKSVLLLTFLTFLPIC